MIILICIQNSFLSLGIEHLIRDQYGPEVAFLYALNEDNVRLASVIVMDSLPEGVGVCDHNLVHYNNNIIGISDDIDKSFGFMSGSHWSAKLAILKTNEKINIFHSIFSKSLNIKRSSKINILTTSGFCGYCRFNILTELQKRIISLRLSGLEYNSISEEIDKSYKIVTSQYYACMKKTGITKKTSLIKIFKSCHINNPYLGVLVDYTGGN